MQSLISSAVSYYIPIDNEYLRWHIGSAIGDGIGDQFDNVIWPRIKKAIPWGINKITILEYHDGDLNPTYTKLDDYFSKKREQLQNKCARLAVPKRGTISFINDTSDMSVIYDKYNDHQIKIEFEGDHVIGKKRRYRYSNDNAIVVSSRTATDDELEIYIKDICKHKNLRANIIKVYQVLSRYDVKGGQSSKDSYCYWDDVDCHTNKTFDNVILANDVYVNLRDDLEWFLHQEDWFNSKGIPYRRGYLLHGPPGTGKTSIIKAIANVYGFMIFNINLNVIPNDGSFIKLIMDLNYYAQDNPYIMCFEDIDRSALFSPSMFKVQNISMNTFLNVLDGIIESHGGITILTCNNDDILRNYPALIRPGRVDKDIKIDFCTNDQVIRMMKHFYSERCENPETLQMIESINLPYQIAPAVMSQLMIENKDNPELVHEKLIQGHPSGREPKQIDVNNRGKKRGHNNANDQMVYYLDFNGDGGALDYDNDYHPPQRKKNKTLTDLKKELKSFESNVKKNERSTQSLGNKIDKLKDRIKKKEDAKNK
jgi:ATP-dependent 26S proteasome regulatory subunit